MIVLHRRNDCSNPRRNNRVVLTDDIEHTGRSSTMDMDVDLNDAFAQSSSHWILQLSSWLQGLIPLHQQQSSPGDRPGTLLDAADRVSASAPGNEELSKLLRKLGYPEVQEAIKPSTVVSRAITALNKRLVKLDELMKALSPVVKKPEAKNDKPDDMDLRTRTGP